MHGRFGDTHRCQEREGELERPRCARRGQFAGHAQQQGFGQTIMARQIAFDRVTEELRLSVDFHGMRGDGLGPIPVVDRATPILVFHDDLSAE